MAAKTPKVPITTIRSISRQFRWFYRSNDAPVESYSLALTVGSGHYRRIEIANVFELF